MGHFSNRPLSVILYVLQSRLLNMLDEIDDQDARRNIKSVLAGFCSELADDLGLSETLALEQFSRFIKIVYIDAIDEQIC